MTGGSCWYPHPRVSSEGTWPPWWGLPSSTWQTPSSGSRAPCPLEKRRGALVVVDEMQSMPGVDYESMLSELGKFGASFVLATQSLEKLDDLSPTMRGTLLANVGCLAAFQVAGSDARQLVWELGKDRITEEDIVSLPVHHCYVRATVEKERMPAFSMMVRKPEGGDPTRAARIRDLTSSYVTSHDEISLQQADAPSAGGRVAGGHGGTEGEQETGAEGENSKKGRQGEGAEARGRIEEGCEEQAPAGSLKGSSRRRQVPGS